MSSESDSKEFKPKTESGKELFMLLNKRDMNNIFKKLYVYLINYTAFPDRFARKLVSVNMLEPEETTKIMQTVSVSARLTKIYEQVKEKKNWEKLIYSWEECNPHVIEMLLKYVQDDESTTKALHHVRAEKSVIADNLLRSYTRRMNTFLPCFLLTIFFILVIFYIESGVQRERDISNPEVPNLEASTAELPLILDVNSANDLNNLDGVETVVISNLEDELTPMSKKLSLRKRIEYNTIKNLTIAGRISISWLEYMIGAFKNLKNFSLDMSQTCLGVAIDSPSTHTPLKLENCESFNVLNSKTCYLESWIYRWEFPVLKQITFVNVDINRRNCPQLNSLVNERVSNQTSVYFKDCNVYNCHVSLGTKTLIKS
ncbi:unnamed protein product [Allacma fusca]|uniref:Uncharacterized protein n=1 Tax=Allacma fusca TaxID=39272 RepID=A0A8J2PLU0_9HEXA|nr:unnamed protein product [Allacma fusca]